MWVSACLHASTLLKYCFSLTHLYSELKSQDFASSAFVEKARKRRTQFQPWAVLRPSIGDCWKSLSANLQAIQFVLQVSLSLVLTEDPNITSTRGLYLCYSIFHFRGRRERGVWKEGEQLIQHSLVSSTTIALNKTQPPQWSSWYPQKVHAKGQGSFGSTFHCSHARLPASDMEFVIGAWCFGVRKALWIFAKRSHII